jgi:hypothetical protein
MPFQPLRPDPPIAGGRILPQSTAISKSKAGLEVFSESGTESAVEPRSWGASSCLL